MSFASVRLSTSRHRRGGRGGHLAQCSPRNGGGALASIPRSAWRRGLKGLPPEPTDADGLLEPADVASLYRALRKAKEGINQFQLQLELRITEPADDTGNDAGVDAMLRAVHRRESRHRVPGSGLSRCRGA